MQMKYLSLALAAALATTLTACGGSDNKSNYNKDTLTPVSPGTTTPEKEDPQGGKEDPQGGKEDPKDPEKEDPKDPEKEDEDKTEEPGENVPNPEDNPGNAAESGDKAKEPSVVGQQYIRGASSGFDTVNNKEYNANATVISYVPLQNKQMTNIVVAEYDDVTRKDANGNFASVKYLLGENPKINPNPNHADALQTHNAAQLSEASVDDSKLVSGKLIQLYSQYKYSELKTEANKPANSTNVPLQNFWSQVDTLLGTDQDKQKDYDKLAAADRADLINSQLAERSKDATSTGWRWGVVTVGAEQGENTDTSATFDVDGQENSIITNKAAYEQGQTAKTDPNQAPTKNEVRIYGANSQYIGSTDKVQSYYNSTALFPTYVAGQDKLIINQGGIKPSTTDDGTSTGNAFGKIGNDEAGFKLMKGLLINEIADVRFDNVQYGRVTGNLTGVTAEQIVNKEYIRADLADKFSYAAGTTKVENDKKNGTTDVYFYRGLNQTALADMPKEGKYNYVGHALMYGIDNTYAGPGEKGKSNSVAFGGNAAAIGNYVQAEYDAAKQDVKGSVYNVWYKQSNNKQEQMQADKEYLLERVDLVNFNGKVVGNSITGTADRTYVDGDDKAAYKGSFYGSNIAEMGGSFNSVTDGYADSKWGGVFGAKLVKQGTTVPVKNRVD